MKSNIAYLSYSWTFEANLITQVTIYSMNQLAA